VLQLTAPSRAGTGSRRGLVAALAVTTTAGYGVLYYAFGVLLGPMSADLGIPTATAAGALTLAVLTTGAMSVPVGRWLDARGGRGLMTGGALLGATAVLAWSRASTVAELYGVFALIGVASAMVLYEPAFAVVVATVRPARRAGALLTVTLVGGLASTIFMPLTGQLNAHLGWRHTLQVLAIVYGLLAVPLHAVALPRAGAVRRPARHSRRLSVSRALRDRGFWLVTAAFVLSGGALGTVSVHLVLFLTRAGHPAARAAALAGLLGLLSVTGRVLLTALRRWLPVATVTAAVLVLQGIAIAALPAVGGTVAGATVCIVVIGLGFGLAAIATPAILLERYGPDGYGTVAGTLAAPVLVARATAPAGAAVLAGLAGYRPVMLTIAAMAGGAATCLLISRWLPPAERLLPQVAVLDDGGVGTARAPVADQQREQDSERTGAHQDVADHGQVDAADPVRDGEGQDRADGEQENSDSETHLESPRPRR
jgi:predicted MFS family arabinose efflux permease